MFIAKVDRHVDNGPDPATFYWSSYAKPRQRARMNRKSIDMTMFVVCKIFCL